MNLSKAPWTQKEDEILCQIIQEKGAKKWKEIAVELNERAGNTKFVRQGKQCRERWINHLDPSIERGAWSTEEDIKLLEAHLEVGKKWADISKRLKNRTENAVKNRWNSLMKKYKNEALDSDTLSTLSAQTGGSVEDLERRIAELIISDKRNEISAFGNRLPAVNEEDEYSTGIDMSEELSKNDEEERVEKKKMTGAKKKTGLLDVKNTLKELVHQEIDTKQQKKSQPTSNPLLKSPLLPTGISQINNSSFVNNPLLGTNTSKQPTMNQQKDPNVTLFNQLSTFNSNQPVNNLFSVPNGMFDLNLLMMNPNHINLFNPSSQPSNPANNQAQMMHSPPSNMMSPSVQMRAQQGGTMNTGSLSDVSNGFSLSNIQTVSAYPDPNPDPHYQQAKSTEDEKTHKYQEKPLEQLDINSIQNNTLQYAIVDTATGTIYFVSPVTKDNFPPTFMNIPKPYPKELPRKQTFDVMSPALGNVNFSPGIFNNNLFNLVQNQFSPSVNNIIRESPQINPERRSYVNTQQQVSNTWEWTPDSQTRQIPFMNNPNKMTPQQTPSNVVWGGAYKTGNSPDQRFSVNNSAFLKKTGMSGEGTSPTSFLDQNKFGKILNKLPNM